MYRSFFKRVIDFLFSFLGLLLISPIFLIVLVLLYIFNEGKPFFFQERPGMNEKIFRIIKFKTMNDKKGNDGELLPDSERLTKVGSIIRKTSLDELPQLLNVIKGDMSLIGPRPLLLRYLPFYTDKERIRHTIKPGITGWAQINGRNTVSWDERLAYDVEYVKKLSFMFDVKILYKTVLKIIVSEDIVIDPESIMKNFDDERRI
ncbi:Sugar transferase involved in LPS biosynthesis (colanic, teichoic acid) [Tenacibaculum sp. MAR_2010_89]|uniref:sugar transferase n=1 Tax=Tenacibaculum sp. MAR_2010_89 TaxID=1250198 RepID=UPI0008975265|nr:sugar transferase [Tenacibaculum sp. MAR_2010_89]SED67631.1 Sugar transferase involved in LPS biosynthesis (colanic, teichoic acid) [Tenacibaculum sp. MAR_2010_89]